jgi:hypothetical protein
VFIVNMLIGMGLALGIDYSPSSSRATARSALGLSKDERRSG